MARIALDIDSTLHHYWDLLAGLSESRYGVELPYAEQRGWGIERLAPEQLKALVEETHSEANILAAEPYPDAVETVRDWHAAGHWIHITSHRAVATCEATARWLDKIAMPYDDLHCSYDKVTRCVELAVDVLVDDSPVNLAHAREQGILGATIVHPWNAELVGTDGVVGGRDWRELRARLDPVLADIDAAAQAAGA
jgi:phosphoglycolate phosphatase-like HAD superfamily hydrolase